MAQLTNGDLKAIFDAIETRTALPCVELAAVRRACSVYDSKLGGLCYMPAGFAYPHAPQNTGGAPLRFLAQLNFGRLPKLPDFPQEGILQFFIAQDDIYGADFDRPTKQAGFRVIYHAPPLADEASLLTSMPSPQEIDEDYFPFQGEFALEAKAAVQPMPPVDFRFDRLFLEECAKYIETDARDAYDVLGDQYGQAVDRFTATGHRMGGYPFFTQSDIRGGDNWLGNHTVLLLQIDSAGSGADEIIWGDCGVANFFITPESLAKLDFSDVLYTWDCC